MAAPVILGTLEDTAALGQRLAAQLKPRDVVLMHGDLGAGKTTLSRAIIEALLGHAEEVPSPTFTLVQTYDTPRGAVYHFDLYRLKHPDEIYELGWEDALVDGIALVEWPERLGSHAPRRAKHIRLSLDAATGSRTALLEGFEGDGI